MGSALHGLGPATRKSVREIIQRTLEPLLGQVLLRTLQLVAQLAAENTQRLPLRRTSWLREQEGTAAAALGTSLAQRQLQRTAKSRLWLPIICWI